MNLNKFLLLSSIALMFASCQDKEPENPKPIPTPGAEVSFGGEVGTNALSRTEYDFEKITDASTAFPINWLMGDQVLIHSPHSPLGHHVATYQVPNDAHQRNYAGEFSNITGEGTGVQWGSEAKHTFYSIYPAKYVDEVTGPTHSFNLRLDNMQKAIIKKIGDKWIATPDMTTCFMFAKNANVDNGSSTVKLRYKPLSTAIRIKINGPTLNVGNQNPIIKSVRLIAPNNVALSGKFSVDLTNATPTNEDAPEGQEPILPVATAADPHTSTETYNYVEILPYYEATSAYLTLSPGESMVLTAFIIPLAGQSIGDGWSVEVNLQSGGKLTKSLNGSVSVSGKSMEIKAGKIHNLPGLPNIYDNTTWDPKNWMVNIPRNVYLSEISIPGSWNSLNQDFQTMSSRPKTTAAATNVIDGQYAVGARLFHLDTRFRTNKTTQPTEYETDMTLAIANGGDTYHIMFESNNVMQRGESPDFSAVLTAITNNVKTDEYIVVICTFAQNSWTPPVGYWKTAFGIPYEFVKTGDNWWYDRVSEACASNSKVIDASSINEDTTVGDVLGKVIVIIATEDPMTTLSSSSKCLLTHLPNTRTSAMYPSTAGYFDAKSMYCNGTASGITLNCTQAQISSNTASAIQTDDRGYAPTMTQRQTVGGNILTWAKNNYSNQEGYKHNQWMYQGLGGYKVTNASASVASDSYHGVAREMSTWIRGKISEMSPTGTTRYYPVGLILMNFVTDIYSTTTNQGGSKEAVNDILQLNNKFHKQYDPDKPAWPGQGTTVQSKAPGYSSGMTDNNTNVIGWD